MAALEDCLSKVREDGHGKGVKQDMDFERMGKTNIKLQ